MQIRILAEEIVKKLVDAGYTAYFAGGWVRDFLMKHPSSDIDIATGEVVFLSYEPGYVIRVESRKKADRSG